MVRKSIADFSARSLFSCRVSPIYQSSSYRLIGFPAGASHRDSLASLADFRFLVRGRLPGFLFPNLFVITWSKSFLLNLFTALLFLHLRIVAKPVWVTGRVQWGRGPGRASLTLVQPAHTGTTLLSSQHGTELLHCICNNIATKCGQSSTVSSTVGIYYICIIENRYSVFARSALYTQNAQHSAIGPSYRQQLLLAIADQPN